MPNPANDNHTVSFKNDKCIVRVNGTKLTFYYVHEADAFINDYLMRKI